MVVQVNCYQRMLGYLLLLADGANLYRQAQSTSADTSNPLG